jgi:hypothetical protein
MFITTLPASLVTLVTCQRNRAEILAFPESGNIAIPGPASNNRIGEDHRKM